MGDMACAGISVVALAVIKLAAVYADDHFPIVIANSVTHWAAVVRASIN